MKKIIATIAIVLTAGFLGAQVASAHGHGNWGSSGSRHWGWGFCNPVHSRMGRGMMGYGVMGRGMPGSGHGPWTCWTTTRGRSN